MAQRLTVPVHDGDYMQPLKDGKLILKIDLKMPPAPSASVKTCVVAGIHGNQLAKMTI